MLTLVVARDTRREVLEVERELLRLTQVVDDFNARLGARNWIFHDLLNVDAIETLLAETSTADDAERRLIDLYRDSETTKSWLVRFKGRDGLRQRLHQIQRARKHYDADEFDSCVLQLIAVMDGFVNDFQPDVRKGLASRDPDDMTAWDSVVGHHLGLTHAMATFRTTIKKRVDEEVFEVYRHGIVHGAVVNFDNVVVATKAWNMLFAVADWASATTRAARPRERQPTWREVWAMLMRHAAVKKHEADFTPTSITPADPAFENDEVVQRARAFLDAWTNKRWGLVAAFTPPVLLGSKSDGAAARYAKDTFGQYDVTSWELRRVTRDRPSTAQIRGTATVNGKSTNLEFPMTFELTNGDLAVSGDANAAWRVAVWAPNTYFEDSTESEHAD